MVNNQSVDRWNQPRIQSIALWVTYITRSQGLAAFKSNMAARFWHVRIPRKNSAFLHDLEAYHELESIQI